jgi:sterol desaturase/sphingolipid hydroxylase (fatty acid hydroxylase superfamily)
MVHFSHFFLGVSDWMHVERIPVRGKHLDDLSSTDRLFIGLSKAQTGPFLYLLLRYCYQSEPNVLWTFHDATVRTVLLPLPAIFVIYDFFYTLLHWFLHIKSIYPLIHKHHHHQKAPSRATDDAVNVHPIEFTLGEYNHWWAIFLYCRFLSGKIHIFGVLLFLATGGVLAGWNHTRFDISFSIFGVIPVFDSKAHDVHHRIPQSNYGQYTMFWDKLFGTYRPYDPTDRVNPKAQLDPKTGKCLTYSPPSWSTTGIIKTQ